MSNQEESFTGNCPTCGQSYMGDEIGGLRGIRHMEAAKFLSEISAYKGTVERLQAALEEIVSLTDRHWDEVPHYNTFLFIARKALNND